MPVPRGGGAKLPAALVQLIRDRGGMCETGVDVERVLVQMGRGLEQQALPRALGHDRRSVLAALEDVGGRLEHEVGLGLGAVVAGEAVGAEEGEDFFFEVDGGRALEVGDGDRCRIGGARDASDE